MFLNDVICNYILTLHIKLKNIVQGLNSRKDAVQPNIKMDLWMSRGPTFINATASLTFDQGSLSIQAVQTIAHLVNTPQIS